MENNTEEQSQSIFVTTGKQVWNRKWLIWKRVTLITLPVLLILSPIFLLAIKMLAYVRVGYIFPFPVFVIPLVSVLLILLAMLYGTVAGNIFKLEKHIWLDSYFDGKNLESHESWQLAKLLYKTYLRMQFKLKIKYYTVWLLVASAVIGLTYFLSSHKMFNLTMDFFTIVTLISLFSFAVVWLGLRSYLRFFIYVFLDKFGEPGFSLETVLAQMKQLTNVNKPKSFSFETLLWLLEEAFSGTSHRGGFRTVVRSYGYEYTNFAKIAAVYYEYRRAHKQVFGVEQNVNANLYSLIGK